MIVPLLVVACVAMAASLGCLVVFLLADTGEQLGLWLLVVACVALICAAGFALAGAS